VLSSVYSGLDSDEVVIATGTQRRMKRRGKGKMCADQPRQPAGGCSPRTFLPGYFSQDVSPGLPPGAQNQNVPRNKVVVPRNTRPIPRNTKRIPRSIWVS
jgi:hypothetical protein